MRNFSFTSKIWNTGFLKNLTSAFIFVTMCVHFLHGQGCVAVRQMSNCTGAGLSSNLLGRNEWQVGMNYRYFKSFRHFRGTHEEADRVANGTEVINHAHGFDFALTYGISDRFYLSANIPFVINERSSLYEHGRTERHSSFSRGLADIRLGAGLWLLSPVENPKGNIAMGVGIKLPTGAFSATDIFYNVGPSGTPQVRPVDQSIQPGDGGFSPSLDVQLYRMISSSFSVYGNGFYMFSPRETNGVRTFRETLNPILANEAIMSVSDQFAARLGVTYNVNHAFGAGLGLRYEGVPVEDILGGSQGFRRPGSTLSVEPSINYMKGGTTLFLSVPVAIRRERPQSVTDLETEIATGTPRNGDSAFADYLISFGAFYRIPHKMIHLD
jgi:hypothetical protein